MIDQDKNVEIQDGSQYKKANDKLKITENQFKGVVKRVFDTVDIKGRGALDIEEFRELLIFVTEDIFIHQEHNYDEYETDQKDFLEVWKKFNKQEILFNKKEDIV